MDKIIKYFFFFTLLTFITNDTYAAKKKVSGKGLVSKLKLERENIAKLKTKILNIESKLTSTNKRYILIEKEKTKLDVKIYQSSLTLKKLKSEVVIEIERMNKVINSLLVTNLNKNSGNDNVLKTKLLKKVAVLKTKQLRKQLNDIAFLEKEVTSFKNKLNDSYELAGELSDILTHMEAQKKLLANNYLEKVKVKEELEVKYKKYQLQKKKKRKRRKIKKSRKGVNTIKMKFFSPIEKFITKEHEQEGVTYKFQGSKQVRCPQNGQVVFSGPLGNYGNVVVLNHGNETRSVIWGNFKPIVKKSDVVKKGQLVGQASTKNMATGTISFEVRHKKQIQNTFKLIEKERYSRNNTSVKQLRFEGT